MISELQVEYVKYMPTPLKQGVLYISKEFELAIHLCACGCGGRTVTPFSRIIAGKDHGWTFTFNNDDTVTLRPSIGNFSPPPYHAHYYITNNKIQWCEPVRPDLLKR